MMDLQGLDYNTRRKKLELPEYGREIQKMVEYAMTIEDRSKRQQCAETIVKIMQRVAPLTTNDADSIQKYWDHLAIMSGFKLDIDYPYDITEAHSITEKPQPLAYTQKNIPVKHYGAMLFKVFEQLKNMPEGKERDMLVEETANHMKMCLMEYSHGSADEEKVADDLARYTDGKIQLDLDTFRFANVNVQRMKTDNKKKKK